MKQHWYDNLTTDESNMIDLYDEAVALSWGDYEYAREFVIKRYPNLTVDRIDELIEEYGDIRSS